MGGGSRKCYLVANIWPVTSARVVLDQQWNFALWNHWQVKICLFPLRKKGPTLVEDTIWDLKYVPQNILLSCFFHVQEVGWLGFLIPPGRHLSIVVKGTHFFIFVLFLQFSPSVSPLWMQAIPKQSYIFTCWVFVKSTVIAAPPYSWPYFLFKMQSWCV